MEISPLRILVSSNYRPLQDLNKGEAEIFRKVMAHCWQKPKKLQSADPCDVSLNTGKRPIIIGKSQFPDVFYNTLEAPLKLELWTLECVCVCVCVCVGGGKKKKSITYLDVFIAISRLLQSQTHSSYSS